MFIFQLVLFKLRWIHPPPPFFNLFTLDRNTQRLLNCSVANKIQHRESLESIFKGLGAIPWALPLWWTTVLVTGALVRRRRRKEKVEALWEEKKKKRITAPNNRIWAQAALWKLLSPSNTPRGAVAPYSTVYKLSGNNCSLETNPLDSDWKSVVTEICSKSILVPESLLPHPILLLLLCRL